MQPCNHAPNDSRKMIHEAMSTPKLHCELYVDTVVFVIGLVEIIMVGIWKW